MAFTSETYAVARAAEPSGAGERPGFDLDLDGDTLREECGVFGIYGHPDAAAITALGLHALQHRGQEAAGIVSFDGHVFHSERKLGLVGDSFSDRATIERLEGLQSIGHVRYSTTGETVLRNVQPLFAELAGGGFAVAHNGNLTNGLTLRRNLIADGAICQSTTDTEVIVHLVARSRPQPLHRPIHRGHQPDRGRLRARRHDEQEARRRARPLRHPAPRARRARRRYILASETCALDIIGARFVRDIENGEVVVISERASSPSVRAAPSARGPASSNTSTSPAPIPS
jgi:amidophosphoribosyltransferase